MFEINFANLTAFALSTLIGLTGESFKVTLTKAQTPPVGGTLLGTTTAVQSGVATMKLTTGAGPTLMTHFTGYWTADGG